MKAVIYARYSSSNQTEQSIEGQLRDCTEFAKAHDITIVGTYIDRAISAKTDQRKEFQKMIKDSKKNIFDTIITYKIDRFARNRYDSAIYKAELKKNGVKVLYAKEHIPNGPEGIILESLLEGMAEYYSAELSQKIKRGMRESAHKCQALGGMPPLGYKIAVDKKYVIDDSSAHIVKQIFEMYDNGASVTEICTAMNKKGYKTSSGVKFNKNSLWRMLKNEKYIGVYEAIGIRTEGGIPAIIEKELFDRVQDKLVLNKKRAGSKKTKMKYALSGKLYCGHCGAGMIGESGTSRNKGTKYYYYKCSAKKNKKNCDKKTVRKDWLEDLVVRETVNHILKPDKIKVISKSCVDISKNEEQNNLEIKAIKKQITAVNKSLNNIMKAIEQGIITTSTKERLKELEQTKEKLEFELSLCAIKHPVLTEEHIEFMLSQFITESEDITEEYKQDVIECFVNSVYLYNNKLVITYNLTNQKTELESSVVETLTSVDIPSPNKGSDIVSNGGGEENRI